NLTTRILALPSVDPREIKDIVELQAVKQTPYTREEITSGFYRLESDASGYSRILLAIAHRDTPTRYFRIAELAGLLADRITVSVEGVEAWFQMAMSREQPDAAKIVLLLDVNGMN